MNSSSRFLTPLRWMPGALLTLSLHAPAATPRWDFVVQSKQNVYYIDPASVEDQAGRKQAWTLLDYRQPQTLTDGQQYRSTRAQVQVNCKEKRARLVHLGFYSGTMLSGSLVQQQGMLQDWLEIEPGSPMQRIAYRLC